LKLPLTDLAGQTFQVNYFNSQFLWKLIFLLHLKY
jgi:hypothetical protein